MTKPRKEILNVVAEITDELEEQGLTYLIEQADGAMNSFVFNVHDKYDYINSGIVDWSEKLEQVVFLGHNTMTENHDVAEGIPVEESRCWWDCKNIDIFIMHLDGTVRQVVRKSQALKYKKDT